jgi:Co/Zn/Cd efflux system component
MPTVNEIRDVEKKYNELPDSSSGNKAPSAAGDNVSVTSQGRAKNIKNAVGSILGDADMWPCCGCQWSKNARTFFLSFFMFSTITAAQVSGALIANSNALLEDCASMGLDAIGYLINLYAECKQEPSSRKRQRNNLIASGISHCFLVGITIYFLYDALGTIKSGDYSGSDCTLDDNCTGCSDTPYKVPCEYSVLQGSCQWDQNGTLNGCDAPDDVNPYIVFAFATAGLLFDLVCLWPFFVFGCPCFKRQGDEEDKEADAVRMNLFSALMHVMADLVRSTTTFAESILIWAFGINGDKCDTWATVVIGVTIVLGMIKPIYDWLQNLVNFCNAEDDSDNTQCLLQNDEE